MVTIDAIAPLAASVVAVLAPYLPEPAKEVAKDAAKTAANMVGLLYQTLKNHIERDPTAKKSLMKLSLIIREYRQP